MFLSNMTEGTLPPGVMVDGQQVVPRGVKLVVTYYVLGGLAPVHVGAEDPTTRKRTLAHCTQHHGSETDVAASPDHQGFNETR